MAEIVESMNGIAIRLTGERWAHITEEHSELAGMRFDVLEVVQQPEAVYKGKCGELFAVREIDSGKWLVAIYRELYADGFIITAYLTRRVGSLKRRDLVWSAAK